MRSLRGERVERREKNPKTEESLGKETGKG